MLRSAHGMTIMNIFSASIFTSIPGKKKVDRGEGGGAGRGAGCKGVLQGRLEGVLERGCWRVVKSVHEE